MGLITQTKHACIYCGSSSWGRGCQMNPDGSGRHIIPDDPTRCRFCGSSSRGRGCQLNPPTGIHVRGTGGRVCVWCGSSQARGGGCKMNPAKVHSVFYEPPPTEGVQGVHHAQPPTPRCEKIDSPTLGFDSSEIDLTGFWRDKFARFQARRLIPSHSALNWTGILLFTAISTWGVAMTLPKVIGDTSPSSAISNQLEGKRVSHLLLHLLFQRGFRAASGPSRAARVFCKSDGSTNSWFPSPTPR